MIFLHQAYRGWNWFLLHMGKPSKWTKLQKNIAKTFLQRLNDKYSQNALRYLNKDENTDNGKMQFLRKIKDTYNFEPYLNIQNDQHRKSMSQIRLSSHRLAIETGRWQNILRENCNLNKIETESLSLVRCNKIILREAGIINIKLKTRYL